MSKEIEAAENEIKRLEGLLAAMRQEERGLKGDVRAAENAYLGLKLELQEAQAKLAEYRRGGDIGPNLAGALAKAQGEIRNATADTFNEFFRKNYANLAGVWDACRGALSKNGIAVFQFIRQLETPRTQPFTVYAELITRLVHESGEACENAVDIRELPQERKNAAKEFNAQSYGSALTYAKRVGLMMAAGVAPAEEDDDGNAASGNYPQHQQGGRPPMMEPGRLDPQLEEAVDKLKPEAFLMSIGWLAQGQNWRDLAPGRIAEIRNKFPTFAQSVNNFASASKQPEPTQGGAQ